jgi:hypothetical protein
MGLGDNGPREGVSSMPLSQNIIAAIFEFDDTLQATRQVLKGGGDGFG